MQIDDRIGDAIERAIGAHHRRRLRRLGWEHALDARGPAWASGEPPPRSGNAVEVLVDGAQALPRIAEELRRAESHVHLAGWHVTPTFRLGPSPEDELRAILADCAERVSVRVLLWGGAPLPLFRPSRGDVRELREPPTDGFRLVVLLPARPNDGADDTRGQLGVLAEADDGRGRLLACTIRQRGPGSKLVYVHAKIGIVDDAWLTLGSANLNEHSLFNDTEVNVVVRDSALVRQTRLRLWAEHLERDPGELEGDPTEVVDGLWRPLADEPDHRLARLRHVSRRSKRLVGPLRSLVVDGCALKSRPPGSDSSTVRKIAPLLLVPFLAAACGGGSLSAAGAEHYLRTTAGVPHAHCRPGHSGWSYVCTVRRAKRAFRVAVVVDGRRVKETTELLPLRGPLPPVPGSPEARVAEFLADASAICSRRTTLVAAIPHPRNVYAAYRLMG